MRLSQLGSTLPDPFAPPPSAAVEPASAPAPVVVPAVPFAPPQLTLPPEVELYSRLGLVDDAAAAMKKAEPSLRAGLSDEVASIALCAAYQRIQEYARAYKLAAAEHSSAIRQRPLGVTRAHWDALFPRPYLDDVQQVTQQNQLPDDFVYSIMRQESSYDAGVVSSANAVGLLQLIEPTARTIASELGITPWKKQLLFQPAYNIRLGARYLADLLSRYHGQAVPAIAAYNAGEHRVGAWLARGEKRHAAATKSKDKRVELDRFVEDIPIEQTRNYVRRVVANWARYRYLAHPETLWPFTLPEYLSSQPPAP
jgi:soluble lytic murein transglycosylase